jgi:beta-lactamase regulating signal transducer with metallopeptidase domain
MTLQLLISLLAKTAVLLSFAGGVAFLLRRFSAAARHAVWGVAVVLLLLVPFVSVSLPALTLELPLSDHWIEIPHDAASTAVGDSPAVAAGRVSGNTPAQSVQDEELMIGAFAAAPDDEAAPPKRGTTTRPMTVRLERWILLIWIAGAFVHVFTLLMGVYRVHLITRGSAAPERLQARGNLIAAELDIRQHVRIRCSAQVNVPLTWGLLGPAVLLPEYAKQWTEERLRVVLLHEMAHIKRWDYLTHLVTQFTLAGYWFNPLVWLAVRCLSVEQERACDDYVLQVGTEGHVYAQHLVDIAQAFHTRGMRGAVSMAQTNMLKTRVRAILDGQIDRRPVSAWSGLVTLVAMVATALPLTTVDLKLSASQSGGIGSSVSVAFGHRALETMPTATQAAASIDTLWNYKPEYLFIEAESGTTRGAMQLYEDGEASGGLFVMVPEQSGGASKEPDDYVEYRFEVREPGPFVLWGRVKTLHKHENSFFVSVDGKPEIIWDAPGPDDRHTQLFDRTAREWSWDAVSSREPNTDLVTDPILFNLTAGNHTLYIRNREDNTPARCAAHDERSIL